MLGRETRDCLMYSMQTLCRTQPIVAACGTVELFLFLLFLWDRRWRVCLGLVAVKGLRASSTWLLGGATFPHSSSLPPLTFCLWPWLVLGTDPENTVKGKTWHPPWDLRAGTMGSSHACGCFKEGTDLGAGYLRGLVLSWLPHSDLHPSLREQPPYRLITGE